jgi:hypothetical protein
MSPKFDNSTVHTASALPVESNAYHQLTYGLFVMCALYTTSFLPYGRFFQRVGGNWGFLGSYFFIFAYLGFNWLRRPILLELATAYIHSLLDWLTGDPEEELEEEEIYD